MNDYKWNRYKMNKQSNSAKERRRTTSRSVTKPYETEEEATIRRLHDAQRMARFRARKRKALETKALETGNEFSQISELKRSITFKNVDSIITVPNITQFQSNFCTGNPSSQQSKYSELLKVIQELGKDIRLTYAGSKISAERMKIGIIKARILIKECLLETEMNSR
ncbi:cyclin-dependent kinase 2-associated protein 1-like [Osmia bicornis bicornis]|uniref:cyclin-dependent kinase 2-associated protein 1-like n=1 Tax=Osmia bicornis bicornis TaxID=1437191 RepID=UPI0010F54348|nr:cyclin-dependent kinase 2-associated protein 1-like [Osmia bicornis bicornis]XP_046143579.1 cyclin-dependent kinase 2-associated protein 1-like [Osmia bicornis bicornis]XP_046143580.1 cyclin-dependent kinase 2-associated protein 1-like [Osmia bicornis bicornis]